MTTLKINVTGLLDLTQMRNITNGIERNMNKYIDAVEQWNARKEIEWEIQFFPTNNKIRLINNYAKINPACTVLSLYIIRIDPVDYDTISCLDYRGVLVAGLRYKRSYKTFIDWVAKAISLAVMTFYSDLDMFERGSGLK